jgi:hypothetical protein
MSTPLVAPRGTIAGSVVQPTAIIDSKSEAAHGLANVLRTLVTRSVGAYHNELEQDAALQAVSAFEKTLVSQSTLDALHDERPGLAPKEDVSLRPAPSSSGNVSLGIAQSIDYNKLAAAVAAHMMAAQAAANTPEVESGE